ncbi:MAG TPA: tetratricopeptide repeat protein [Pirellulales bacterium]|jgi:tetratricopeptide (TPR) repeat protein|nr:tetratricopeptide repeat protein [Pirellulales bacterium]
MATIFDALTAALRHHREGRLRAAEQIYRQILAVEPNQPEAWHLLGVVAHQAGNHAIAAEYIARAIGLNGSDAAMHNNLGEALIALRRFSESVEPYRRAIELKPDFAEAHSNLGNALKELGRIDEAIASYGHALRLKPDFAEAHFNLGNAVRGQGTLEEAAGCYRRAIGFKPGYAEAHSNLGNVLTIQRKWDEAASCFRIAAELRPDYAEPHNNLGNILREQGNLPEAVAHFRRAVELNPRFVKAHYNLATALAEQGTLEEAAGCYRYVVQLRPDHAEAHNNLGSVLEEMGEFAGAEASFRAALRSDPRFALAHYNLAALLGGNLPPADLAGQSQLLDDADLTVCQQMLLHFGLAKVFDARGQYTAAAEHLTRANARQLAARNESGRAYDPSEFETLVSQMIAACPPEFFERVRSWGSASETPVFVVGLPRSGTTLVEQILASHPQVFGAGELPLVQQTMTQLCGPTANIVAGLAQLSRQAAGELAARHLERLRDFDSEAVCIVDKMPGNTLFLGPLAVLFPRAKVIHCRRDLRDVAVSCWMTYFDKIRWANDPRHIASRFHQYQRLMAHWRQVLPAPMLEIDYEELVADLEGVARRLVAGCGLDWDPACLEFHRTSRPVRTASAVQVRQPVFTSSAGRWMRYQEALASLFEELRRGAAT